MKTLTIAFVAVLALVGALTACQLIVPETVANEPTQYALDALDETDEMVHTRTVPIHLSNTDTVVEDGSSTLERTVDGIHIDIHAYDLKPGDAYTVWWMVYNYPEYCANEPCKGSDMPNEDVQAMLGYATGEIADEEGRARFQATWTVGDTSMALDNTAGFPHRLIEPAPGLVNVMGAEVHAAIMTHGAALEDPTEQLTVMGGGCNPVCRIVQDIIHTAEGLGEQVRAP